MAQEAPVRSNFTSNGLAQLAGAVEYRTAFLQRGKTPPLLTSVLDMTLNDLMLRL